MRVAAAHVRRGDIVRVGRWRYHIGNIDTRFGADRGLSGRSLRLFTYSNWQAPGSTILADPAHNPMGLWARGGWRFFDDAELLEVVSRSDHRTVAPW